MKKEKILFVGDVYADSKIWLDQKMVEICAEHAVCAFNLEGSLSQEKIPSVKAGAHLLIESTHIENILNNFNLAIMANNHAMDFGIEGLISTIAYCKQKQCAYIGAGKNTIDAFNTFEEEFYQIIAVAEHEFGAATPLSPGIATTDNTRLIFEKILYGKERNKKTIVVCHGGTEHLSFPPPYIKERYKLWIDYGADIIIGCHPHVTQGIETYKGKKICYSLGNFAFVRQKSNYSQENMWSIAISYDYKNNSIEIIPTSFDQSGQIKAHSYDKYSEQIDKLNNLINSNNYYENYRNAAKKTFETWYGRIKPKSKNDAALLLHYFRCDAHKNFIAEATSEIIGECKNTFIGGDFKIEPKTISKTDIIKLRNESKKTMQMSINEQIFLQKIIEGKKYYLEIGSGYSTIWFSKFVNNIISVETRKQWFYKIKEVIKKANINNVTLLLFEPEQCAYDYEGKEKWTCRKNLPHKTDYGFQHEFSNYLKEIRNLVNKYPFDAILVDGNVRQDVVELLIDEQYKGIVLLHDVLKEREYLNKPILENKDITIVNQCESLVHIKVKIKNINNKNCTFDKIKLQIGALKKVKNWITTNKDTLDITKYEDFHKQFLPNTIDVILAEHVIEHLTEDELQKFLHNAHEYLKKGGYIRIAVPDYNHPSRFYRDLCRPGGSDIGSEDHKFFYNKYDIESAIDTKMFTLVFLEWWDELGFHKKNWDNDNEYGFIQRSSQFYNGRFTKSSDMRELLYGTTEEKFMKFYHEHNITYTSLIFDLYKK